MTNRTDDIIDGTAEVVKETKNRLLDRKFLRKAGKYALLGTGVAVAAYLGASLVRRPEVVNNLHVDGPEPKQ